MDIVEGPHSPSQWQTLVSLEHCCISGRSLKLSLLLTLLPAVFMLWEAFACFTAWCRGSNALVYACVGFLQTRLWKYDYAGITVLIVTSFIPPIFYGFLCHPNLRNFYLYSTLLLGERMLMT